MQKVKNDLNMQTEKRKLDHITYRSLELETARQSNIEDAQKFIEQKNLKLQKKENEKIMLLNAWSQAQKTKELQNLLELSERKGLKPKSVVSHDKEEFSAGKKETEDEGLQTNLEAEFPGTTKLSYKQSPAPGLQEKKQYLRNKAEKIQDYIDARTKGSYQYKIKQLIKDAKKQREERNNLKKSVSPSSRYPNELSSKNIYSSQRTLKLK